MKSLTLLFLATFSFTQFTCAQDETMDVTLPYHEIPEAPEKFTAETVAARMIDGLGYRYYWATDGLRAEDLAFSPSEKGRTVSETMDHVLGLSRTIANGTSSTPNVRGGDQETLTFEEKRKRTLENIKRASDNLRAAEEGAMEDMKIIFQRGENRSEYPFWNNLNGPIADAIWHTGQIVSHRRSSGNPLNPKVSVFSGKNRE
ncbi:hypothetical protein OAF63_00040 [Saprospiraceae bacterium]|nr:hypothetical protein [Bacteroidota bacterium]MDB4727149.1 hypothetical protein [Saprospiraceae bacterium]MDF1864428.1 hypothetical protein [Saprospiraceae bacterium]